MLIINKEMDIVHKDMFKKLTDQDGKRIWRHFQRFAEYNDLKLLYNKMLPELVKIEKKILDFQHENDQSK